MFSGGGGVSPRGITCLVVVVCHPEISHAYWWWCVTQRYHMFIGGGVLPRNINGVPVSQRYPTVVYLFSGGGVSPRYQ